MTESKELKNLLECVEIVCNGWSWFPEDQYGTSEAICYSEELIMLQDAYTKYCDLEAKEKAGTNGLCNSEKL